MTQQFCIHSKFQDFDYFNESIHAWDLDFIQLNSGAFYSELFQCGDTDFLISSVDFNQSIHQKGAAPKKFWTFAIRKQLSSDFTWKKSLVEQDAIIIYSPGSEIEAISNSGFSY